MAYLRLSEETCKVRVEGISCLRTVLKLEVNPKKLVLQNGYPKKEEECFYVSVNVLFTEK